MNSVNIIGRLTRDPEVKKTEEGRTICHLRIAVSDPYSKEDRADFISVSVFGNQGDACEKYLRKGFMAGVSGRIYSDAYTDADGIKRYPIRITAERVQFLQWPERKEAAPETAPEAAEAEAAGTEELEEAV